MDKNSGANSSQGKYFLGAGIQMAIVIGLGILLGKFLDNYFSTAESQIYTLICTVIFGLIAIVLFIRKAIHITNKND